MIRKSHSSKTSAKGWTQILSIFACFCVFFAASAPSAKGQEGERTTNLDIKSDFTDYDKDLGIAKATGDAVVKYGSVTIKADQIEFHEYSGKVFARDNVRVFKDGQVIDAEEIIYNIHTGELTTSQLKSALEPIFYTSDDIQRPDEEIGGPIVLRNSTFTTHDAANPMFYLRVNKLEVYPENKVVMRGAKLYAGERAIFWFPYFVQPLEEDLGYYFTPGWNSAWGGFLLNQYGVSINDRYLAKIHLDVRTERGIAGGVEFKDRDFKDNDNIGKLFLYHAHDNNPQLRFNGTVRPGLADSERYRMNLQHRVYFSGSDDETFYLDFDINKLSDQYFYEDFFQADYRIDPRPDNLINLTKIFEQGEVSLTGRFQLNEFFRSDTRSPELAIDVIRTPIGNSGFFYDGLTSYGIIDEKLSDAEILAGLSGPSGFNRFHTYHEALFPHQFGGFLNVVPRAGIGHTNYSHFDMPGFDDVGRTTSHLGMDISFKMSRRSPNVVNRALGLDGLLHVVRPYVNYSYLDTDDLTGRMSPIDRLTPSTRLRPIDMPLFTAIDDLSNWQVVRAGISNRWLTKRSGRTHEWLSINNYFDTYVQDPEFDRNFSNFFTDVNWSPLPWLNASTTAQVPLFNDTNKFSELTSALTIMPTDWFRFSLSNYYLSDHSSFDDANLYAFNTYTRLSDNWGISTSHRFEEVDNTLEYQQYMIHRDLAALTANFGGIVRNNRTTDNEYGVIFSLTLKAFPRLSLPVDFQPGSLVSED